jgi:hypothetical protein
MMVPQKVTQIPDRLCSVPKVTGDIVSAVQLRMMSMPNCSVMFRCTPHGGAQCVFAEGRVVSIGWRKAAITRLDSGLNAATTLREFRPRLSRIITDAFPQPMSDDCSKWSYILLNP